MGAGIRRNKSYAIMRPGAPQPWKVSILSFIEINDVKKDKIYKEIEKKPNLLGSPIWYKLYNKKSLKNTNTTPREIDKKVRK